MKKLILSMIGLFISISLFAQLPDAFKYQAVARNNSGSVLSDQQVSFKISILQGSENGTVVYTETHGDTTNAHGLVTLEIGAGITGDDFSAINWANGPFFVQVKMDETGGSDYQLMGTSQLLSVPYAKYSENADTANNVSIQADNGKIYDLKVDSSGYMYTESDLDCPSTVTDYDGNTYDVVKINYQCWMAENLKVTHYSDGTPIPHVTDTAAWSNLTKTDKAWCYYGNSPSHGDTYGVLYTWTAAMNGAESSNSNPSGVQGVCPDGWHLPSNNEWGELESALGDGNNVGSKLADNASLWKNGDLENNIEIGFSSFTEDKFGTSGFTALPGGSRLIDGYSINIGKYGCWWSSHEVSWINESLSPAAYKGYLYYNSSRLYRDTADKGAGLSVRCVRDD